MDNGLNENEIIRNENQNENRNQDETQGMTQGESQGVGQSEIVLNEDASYGEEIIETPEKKKRGLVAGTFIGFFKFVWWLLRMFWKLLKAMWRHKITSLIFMALIAVAAVVLLMARCTRESDAPFDIDFGINKGIEITPNVLTEVKKIGQWEFLSISDEEMVDTVRKGFFTDDELIRIYYGTLRIGLDFSQCEGEWIRTDGDSIILDLPPVKLLDDDFLDETRTQPFIESGKWSNADRQALAERAKTAMRARCLTPENMERAQKTADLQLRQFLEKMLKNENK